MNTDVDLENELLQLVVEELVRAGLRSPLREPILRAVETTPEDRVEVVVPDGTAGTADTEALPEETDEAESAGSADEDAESASSGKGPVTKAAQGLAVFALLFTVLYLALSRLTGDDEA